MRKKVIDITNAVHFFFNRLRIISRSFLVGYSVVVHSMISWAMLMPDITSAQAIIISTVITLATPLTKFYLDSEKNLYDTLDKLEYQNKFVETVDTVGYVVEKLRLFSIAFVIHYAITFVIVLLWSFGLEGSLTSSQATFISVYGGNATLLLGFLMNSESNNQKLAEQFLARQNRRIDIIDKKLGIKKEP